MKSLKKFVFSSILVMGISFTAMHSKAQSFPDLSPIVDATLACEHYSNEKNKAEKRPAVTYVFSKKEDVFRVWQTSTAQHEEGFELKVISVRAARCLGCYQLTSEFGEGESRLQLKFKISNMNVEKLTPNEPSITVEITEMESTDGDEIEPPLIINDFTCWNLSPKKAK
ncbi:MAG TPA: hypothetical protein PLJ21_04600 [Pseudobdellovibrionaceae bacterium]|nr:hypothetical protein [Pseudobdellovibrionaceae bacterium]